MIKFRASAFLLNVLILGGCAFHEDFYDKNLHDKVLACSGGFSEGVQADLAAAYHKSTLSGDASAAFKENTQAVIFSSIRDSDRLRAYEDYIQCIENSEKKSTSHKGTAVNSSKKELHIRKGKLKRVPPVEPLPQQALNPLSPPLENTLKP